MRRKDREVSDLNEIIDIIKKCDVCRIALMDEQYPYIIPLNFGFEYEDNQIKLYFHAAKVGKKLDLIRNNPKVAFEMDCSHHLITGEKACDYTMEYESVIGFGTMEILPEEQTVKALSHLMKQYSKDTSFEFNENYLRMVTVFRLNVEEITGKKLKRS